MHGAMRQVRQVCLVLLSAAVCRRPTTACGSRRDRAACARMPCQPPLRLLGGGAAAGVLLSDRCKCRWAAERRQPVGKLLRGFRAHVRVASVPQR